jgi:Na+/H+-translocating membrane pyrophosphatase
MTVSTKAGEGGTVSRDDIEAKLREIRGQVDAVGETNRTTAVIVGVAVAVAVVALSFLYGRFRGKRRTTVVEVRRV